MTHSTIKPKADAIAVIAGTLLGVAMLLLIRRYQGIYHDSILYLGQGLMQRWPEIYSQDLFFQHGSQGSYSIVPWLLGQAFAWMSPTDVFLWATLASLLLFAAASWLCLHALLPERQRYWAWLGVLCLPSIYGMVRIFSYNEPFLTSRPFAETFCLFGISLLARGRWWLAAGCLAMAGLIHPLQAIGALLIVWPWAVSQDHRWLHAAWLPLPVLLLSNAGIPPFDSLLRQADATWLAELRYSRQVFVTSWDVNDFKTLGFDFFVLGCAWRLLRGQFGGWCIAALAGLVLGVAASLVLVDSLHLILPIGLQLWRVHWLAHWFAMASVAALLCHHLHARQHALALLLALAAQLAWGETAWGWVVLVSLYLAWPMLVGGNRAHLERLLTWLFGLMLILLFASHATNEFHWFKEAGYQLELYPIDRRILVFPAVALGLPLFGACLWERLGPAWRAFAFLFLLCPLALLTASLWDSRNAMHRAVEGTAYRPDIFGATIPQDAQVYWEPESLVATWLVLHRANYYSDGQLAGQMFNRATFAEGLARQTKMLALARERQRCEEETGHDGGNQRPACRFSDISLRQACAPGAHGNPDYLALPFEQHLPRVGIWVVRDPRTHGHLATYWLYKCADMVKNQRRNTP